VTVEALGQEERPVALVIDDDRGARLLACALLEETGFSVEEAPDGLEGFIAFERLRPNLVLLDVVMPKMDGFAVCRKIRASFGGEHLPVLMMTGLDDIDSINRGYKVGATDFITKPINWTILRHRLRYMWRASLVGDDLRKSEAKNRALITALPDLLLHITRDGVIQELRSHDGIDQIFSPVKLLSKRIDEVFPLEVSHPIMENLGRALSRGEMQFFEHRLQIAESQYFYEWRIVSSGPDEALAIVRDITERKQTEERVALLAYHDPLTGLLNRHSFKEHLAQAVDHAQRHQRYVQRCFSTWTGSNGSTTLWAIMSAICCSRGLPSASRSACVRATGLPAGRRSAFEQHFAAGRRRVTVLLPEIKQVQDSARSPSASWTACRGPL